MKKYGHILIAMLGWFSFGITLSALNKFLFGMGRHVETGLEGGGPSNSTIVAGEALVTFHPLLTTSWHMFIHFVVSSLVLSGVMAIVVSFVLRRVCCIDYVPFSLDSVRLTRVAMPPVRRYLYYTVPCALATAADIGLSNVAYKYVTLSAYTMVKATSPAFVLLIAFIMRLERVRVDLVLVIGVMCVGVLLMTMKFSSSDQSTSPVPSSTTHGLLMVFGASFMGAVRWGLTQHLIVTAKSLHDGGDVGDYEEIDLQQSHLDREISDAFRLDSGSDGEDDAVELADSHNSLRIESDEHPHAAHLYMMFQLSPIISSVLFLCSLAIERPFSSDKTSLTAHHISSPLIAFLLMSIGAFLALFMILSEFWLISLTGVVFLSVAGMMKEIITILTAIVLFGDRLTVINWVGLVLSLGAVAYYNYSQFRRSKAVS